MDDYKLWGDPVYDNEGHNTESYYTEVDKEEAIKIAKHFKLKESDLNKKDK